MALNACGSSGKSNSQSASSGSAGIKFAQCMRSHGVPSFPDPGGGGGLQFPIGSGINPQSPAFQSAQSACSKLLPKGGPVHGHASETQKLAMLAMSKCMRAHGLSTFPDPVATAPAPGAGFGVAFGAPGSIIAIPQAMMQSPVFKQAAAQCKLPGFTGGGSKVLAAPAP